MGPQWPPAVRGWTPVPEQHTAGGGWPAGLEWPPTGAEGERAQRGRSIGNYTNQLNDAEALAAAIKQAGEVVISAVGHSSPEEVESQLRIVAAIKQAGNDAMLRYVYIYKRNHHLANSFLFSQILHDNTCMHFAEVLAF